MATNKGIECSATIVTGCQINRGATHRPIKFASHCQHRITPGLDFQSAPIHPPQQQIFRVNLGSIPAKITLLLVGGRQ